MLRIPCPWCGPRDEHEFSCGGDATIARPDPAAATEEQWADYLFMRDNALGVIHERWVHVHGCRQWIVIRRDTRTHEILSSRPAAGNA